MRTLIVSMGLAALAAGPALAQTGPTQASTTAPPISVGAEPVLAVPASSSNDATSTVAGGGTGFGTNVTNVDASTNSASPGQSSSGTLNSSSSIGTTPSVPAGTVFLVPEGTVSVIGGGGAGARLADAPANAATLQAPAIAASNTPIFDQAARDGRAREQRRRDRGEEPRVFGIAPNTERDLTWQMPDDRIIRY